MSAALALYQGLAWAAGPAAGFYLRDRARRGKEDPARLQERFGRTALPRPPGRLLWLHAASVGEAQVAQLVHAAVRARRPDVATLFTTGTRTAAGLLERAAPEGSVRQFAPIDFGASPARFLAHWRPDAAAFAESELWPNLLLGASRRGVRLALVNARMSPASLARWARTPAAAQRLMGLFQVVHCADARTAEGLARLGAGAARALRNLKLASPGPSADPAALAALKAAIGDRPVWLAASTHPGEDEICLAAHDIVRRERADALLIIAPRHPERGARIAELAGGAPRRGLGDLPGSEDRVYVADTLGEMGALYASAPVSLVAGSLLTRLKGHNPIEPARLGSAIISGRAVESFADLYATLAAAGALRWVDEAAGLALAVLDLWADETGRQSLTGAAGAALADGAQALEETAAAIAALIPPPIGEA